MKAQSIYGREYAYSSVVAMSSSHRFEAYLTGSLLLLLGLLLLAFLGGLVTVGAIAAALLGRNRDHVLGYGFAQVENAGVV